MTTVVVSLNEDQIQHLQTLQQQKLYPDAYRYLRDIAHQSIANDSSDQQKGELKIIANWLNRAANINANDGSFTSEFVRGATKMFGSLDGRPISDTQFQDASNNLAIDVIRVVSTRKGIPTAAEIIAQDVNRAVEDLKLPQWGWAGTIGDMLPAQLGGLGQDFVSLPTESARAIGEAYAKALAANGYALGKWISANLPDELNGLNYLDSITGGVFNIASLNPDTISNLITNLQTAFQTVTIVDPIILDMNGDGVKTTSLANGIHLDHDSNNFIELASGPDENDAFLVRDINHNNIIDNGSELFGNHTLLSNGSKAAHGFLALAELDGNHDGKIDANDPAYQELYVLKVKNNTLASDGELLKLDAAGIRSLNTAFTSQNVRDGNGNVHSQTGTYTRTDGTTRAMDDVWLRTDMARTIDATHVDVNDTIAALPDLPGFGNVHSLHQAMARDTSGTLQQLVQTFAATTDYNARHIILDQIVQTWTGADQYAANSRGAYIDGRQLYVLEAFMGQQYTRANGTNPNDWVAARPLNRAYGELTDHLYSQLMMQTLLKPLHHDIALSWNDDKKTFDIDVITMVSTLQSRYASDPINTVLLIDDLTGSLTNFGEFGRTVLDKLTQQDNATNQEMALYLEALAHKRMEEIADDNTSSAIFNRSSFMAGSNGNDQLTGGSGSDIFVGGLGKDSMTGASGDDIYIFNLGDGEDTISDGDNSILGNNILQFGEGILPDMVQVNREGLSLVLTLNATDKVRLESYCAYDGIRNGFTNFIETIRFANGVTWNPTMMADKAIYNGTENADTLHSIGGGNNTFSNRIYGLGGDDFIFGFNGNDTLDGGVGNDRIMGYVGNDVLLGGPGDDMLNGEVDNDTLQGGLGDDALNDYNGSDTYIYNLGDGSDTIAEGQSTTTESDTLQFGAGIDSDAIQIKRDGNNLVLNVNDKDKVTISDYFYAYLGRYSSRIESIRFADGTAWDIATTINNVAYYGTNNADTIQINYANGNRINGLEGNDSITGGNQADVLDGGKDIDTLTGGTGNDTYIVDNAADNTVELQNGGTDTVQSTVAFTLGNHLENLTLTGTADIDGMGNALDNVLTGNSGRNFLTGGEGKDTIVLQGRPEDYTFITDDAVIAAADHVANRDNIDQWRDIEQVTFLGTGQTIAIDKLPVTHALEYIASYPDLINAFGPHSNAGLVHYLQFGYNEGRTVKFDAEKYMSVNPDLVAAYGMNFAAGAWHYIAYGRFEDRPSGQGDAIQNIYNATNPGDDILTGDSGRNFLNGGEGMDTVVLHGNPNDYTFIVDNNLITAGDHVANRDGMDQWRGIEQVTFLGTGQTVSVDTLPVFNALEYIASYPDLMNTFGTSPYDGITHYHNFGYNEGRTVTFDGEKYLEANADVFAAYGMNVGAGAWHYITYGRFENRPLDMFVA